MLKTVQMVRDVLEEVTYVYVELTALGEALKEEGCLIRVANEATEIILAINNMIFTDVGYLEYFNIHAKIMKLCADFAKPSSQYIKDWLLELIEADDEVIKHIVLN